MNIFFNSVHNFNKIGGASIWQKTQIPKRTIKKIMENKAKIITTINS